MWDNFQCDGTILHLDCGGGSMTNRQLLKLADLNSKKIEFSCMLMYSELFVIRDKARYTR